MSAWFEKLGRAPGTASFIEEELIDVVSNAIDVARREGVGTIEAFIDLYSDFMRDIEDLGREIARELESRVPGMVAKVIGSSKALKIVDQEIVSKIRDALRKAGLDCTIYIPKDYFPVPAIVAWCRSRSGEKIQVTFNTVYDRDTDDLEVTTVSVQLGWNPESISEMTVFPLQ